ncbi:MAG: hypothetical protein LUG83_11230 [Lachnospiraceae bacterium]|nr:hypothetical protein [Lachnospiraceae bacterium]
MSEFIDSAWFGWQSYTEAGKLAALPIAIFLFFLLYSEIKASSIKRRLFFKAEEKILYIYAAFMVVLCICPLTAALLMLYQTKFYNYEWIWSYVPMTAVIAAGGSTVFMVIWQKRNTLKDRAGAAFVTVLIVFVAVICGAGGGLISNQTEYLSGSEDNGQDTIVQYSATAVLLEEIMQEYNYGYETADDRKGVCLWGPEEILAYARVYSADIQLLYGRSMWDNALNAYSYDTYTDEYKELYEWMESVAEYGEAAETDRFQIAGALEAALAAGLNVVVLPGNTLDGTRAEMEELLGVQETEINGYFVYVIR